MSETLVGTLERAAAGTGRVYFVDSKEGEHAISHAQMLARAARTAGGLVQKGVVPGDRVAVVAATGPEFFDGFFGAMLAGAVPVPLYPPVRLGRMQEYHLRSAAMLAAAHVRLVVADGRARRVIGRTIERARPELGCVAIAELAGDPTIARDTDPDSLALIQFSSGTTHAPKPVALSHRAVLANVRAIGQTILETHPEGPTLRHRAVSWLPLYHDMGLVGGVFTSLFHGCDLVLIPPELFIARPALWLRALSRHRATISPAPNFAYALCAERIPDSELEGVDLSSWKVAMNGAEPVTPAALERFVARFARYGFAAEALTPVYGLAEATLAVTFSSLREPFAVRHFDPQALVEEQRAVPVERGQPIVSLGRPLAGFEVEIVDDEGEVLDACRLGRVRVRGPSIMRGYDGMEEETRRALTEGWLDTGDIGFLRHGELHLYGRTKDLIVLRGRNFAPQDFEHAIDDLPGVRTGCSAAVAVVRPDGAGEELWIFVERARRTDRTGEDLATAVTRRVLERTGILPARVIPLAPGTLPRTSSGKIRRSEALQSFRRGDLVEPAPVSFPRLALEMLRSRRALRRASS
ncbi:MAG: fatty acyl-AMP ligase [Myxococcales bacterium]|nr:fatty acyl-AMP ligase [Myxococcales bacterium]